MKRDRESSYAGWSLALGIAGVLLAGSVVSRPGSPTWTAVILGSLLASAAFITARTSVRAGHASRTRAWVRWRRRIAVASGCVTAAILLVANPAANWALLNATLEPSYEVLLQADTDPAGTSIGQADLAAASTVLGSRLRASDIPSAIEVEPPDQIRVTLSLWDDFALDRLPRLLETGVLALHIEHPDSEQIRRAASEADFVPPKGYRAVTSDQGVLIIDAQPVLTGGIEDAFAGEDPQYHQPVLNLQFEASAADTLAATSVENLGRRLVITLDGSVLTAPLIRDHLARRVSVYLGDDTSLEVAHDLAVVLRSGPLPVPLQVVEARPLSGAGQG